MITSRHKVKVTPPGESEWMLELVHEDDNKDGATVLTLGGTNIGYVFKSSYTYSPPLHRGSRIAREHRSVKCWATEEGPSATANLSAGFGSDRISHSRYRSRREALEHLVREHLQRGENERQAVAFAKAHPEARFRIEDASRVERVGRLIRPHVGGLQLRPEDGRPSVKIRRRSLEDDQGRTLEVQLRKGARWQPYINVMLEEKDDS